MPKELKWSILKRPGGVLQAMITSAEVPPDKLLRDACEYQRRYREALKQAGPFDRLDIIIDSPGGAISSAAGMTSAIAEAVKAYRASVRVLIDGQCSSAASQMIYELPFKGLKVYMTERSRILVHMPKAETWTRSGGSWSCVTKVAKYLTTCTMISVYKARTRQPRSVIRKWMQESKVFRPREAVEVGFADGIMTLAEFQRGEAK